MGHRVEINFTPLDGTLPLRRTEIVPWTEKWFDLYRKEEVLLRSIFLNELLEIHHIGSTSVPQIGFAKPIIDILIVVKDIMKVVSLCCDIVRV